MSELLQPTVDFVFKRIFGAEENIDVLLAFVNAVFESAEVPLITSVEILNPFLDKGALHDKMSVLDIRARTESGMLVNVEVQLWNRRDIERRTLYYWSKLYAGQLEEGENYRKLNKTITINILDFNYISTERYHTVFHIREDHTNTLLTDMLEIHFVELRKLKEQAIGVERRLVQWMLFLSTRTRERMEELAMQEPAIQKALTTLEFLSQDEETRRLYEERQRALHDYVSDIDGAREEGKAERTLEVVRNLLAIAEPLEKIAKVTGLSPEEIDAIRRHAH